MARRWVGMHFNSECLLVVTGILKAQQYQLIYDCIDFVSVDRYILLQ